MFSPSGVNPSAVRATSGTTENDLTSPDIPTASNSQGCIPSERAASLAQEYVQNCQATLAVFEAFTVSFDMFDKKLTPERERIIAQRFLHHCSDFWVAILAPRESANVPIKRGFESPSTILPNQRRRTTQFGLQEASVSDLPHPQEYKGKPDMTFEQLLKSALPATFIVRVTVYEGGFDSEFAVYQDQIRVNYGLYNGGDNFPSSAVEALGALRGLKAALKLRRIPTQDIIVCLHGLAATRILQYSIPELLEKPFTELRSLASDHGAKVFRMPGDAVDDWRFS